MTFNQFELDPRLMEGIKRAGYQTPTPIQTQAIPEALKGHDLIATAQTGTGKTAAFVLPILNKLIKGPRKKVRALIITPTRELAEQIHENIRTLGNGTGLKSMSVYGGVGANPQIDALRRGVDILVACPGRLLDHIQQGHAKLGSVEILVLDEADRMLDMGFLPDVRRILKHVPNERQTMLFSATFPSEINKLAGETLRSPKRVAIGLSRPAHTVEHAIFPIAQHLKTKLLMAVLEETDTDSVLVFTRTKHRAQRLSEQIQKNGYKAISLHSNRSQGQRKAALNGFKNGQYQVMVATDIAARGLDIDSISHVINYDMPDTADAYIHRIGRTGRAKRKGEAYTFTTPEDDDMVRQLEKIMKQTLTRKHLADFDYDVPRPAQSASRQDGANQRNRNTTHSSRPSNSRRRNVGPNGAARRKKPSTHASQKS
ncbi:MAG: DEAD/DEAH box helicase [Anaerolineae bacterium]|nr:DEAD/DEAH box helicase [Anaerolineae bacterium]